MLITLTYKTTELLIKSIFKNGFNKTSENIYDNIKDLVNYNPELSILLEKHDIEAKINLFRNFIAE